MGYPKDPGKLKLHIRTVTVKIQARKCPKVAVRAALVDADTPLRAGPTGVRQLDVGSLYVFVHCIFKHGSTCPNSLPPLV